MSFLEKIPVARLALFACLAAFAAFAPVSAVRAEVKVGEPFPSLEARDLEGVLPECAGSVVLVDFWATWCSPCKASFPHYGALQTELGPRGLVVIGVSVDQKAAPYDAFLKRHSPAFATVRDGAQKLVAEVRPPAMPTCYLLDRHGVLRLVHSGFHGEQDIRLLRAEIEKLLAESP
ncbi:MAG: TlpA family protein disulfide reductase [Opitutaceae bacterium]|jgi:thiol-disulfide isomerase/thioredoxin|nr:TlpA family protein disulfide reductase [Opitutaceae bacterium]